MDPIRRDIPTTAAPGASVCVCLNGRVREAAAWLAAELQHVPSD